ncbi:hypothetical protein [Larsenimonas rhizosphaerae]|uniref:Uncharacterized protein n=1 Tax=Larsenimonas rhizosphaerae TaxID=2944682 RepID=A0AA41ZK72_9GAMM|nr:hypothetical protein [Larsenimonas rhizosphaerae]MCX2523436.1 hypothetical protein [Larsenimonas rhizosphaerae]
MISEPMSAGRLSSLWALVGTMLASLPWFWWQHDMTRCLLLGLGIFAVAALAVFQQRVRFDGEGRQVARGVIQWLMWWLLAALMLGILAWFNVGNTAQVSGGALFWSTLSRAAVVALLIHVLRQWRQR